jgi:hypothetical protein
VQEAEGIARRAFERLPVVARGFQQRQRADHVGVHEGGRAVDRAIDMAFAAKLTTASGRCSRSRRFDERAVADVAVDEDMVGILREGPERIEVARVGQRVEVHYPDAARTAPARNCRR